jgi:hypothetical protein
MLRKSIASFAMSRERMTVECRSLTDAMIQFTRLFAILDRNGRCVSAMSHSNTAGFQAKSDTQPLDNNVRPM